MKKRVNKKRPQSLVEFIAQSPLAKANLDLERTPDYGREVKLSSPAKLQRRKREK